MKENILIETKEGKTVAESLSFVGFGEWSELVSKIVLGKKYVILSIFLDK